MVSLAHFFDYTESIKQTTVLQEIIPEEDAEASDDGHIYDVPPNNASLTADESESQVDDNGENSEEAEESESDDENANSDHELGQDDAGVTINSIDKSLDEIRKSLDDIQGAFTN